VLVFGAGVVNSALNGLPVTGLLALLGALLTLAATLSPLAIAAALRISLNQ
jgi:heme exporter protein B